jgi:HTH-type transcriptional regulator/antitoxin HigA
MNVRPIKKETDYNYALARVEELWGSKKGTPAGNEFEVWITLIEAYEREKYPIGPPDPISAIEYYMEKNELNRSDLSKYFGSKSLVSDILNGKKTLTLKIIKALHEELGIPYEMLIS